MVGGHLFNEISFADDKAVLASIKKELQKLVKNLVSVADGYWMKVNIKKTKVMQISKRAGNDKNIMLKIKY